MKELTQIPFHDTTIYTTADGTYVALRPVCEALGLDFSGQLQRLRNQAWTSMGVIPTQMPGDDQSREMTFIDRRTFTMWLATIDTGRVKNERTRELVRTYQCEAADALDKYFHEGATADEVTRFASAFGRYVKEAYKAERGVEPGKRFDETPSGQVRETYAYTETDRPIFDRAWSKSYAGGFPEKRARKSKEKK